MQAKKVLDGSKHEYSTALRRRHWLGTRIAITLCSILSIPHWMGQHSVPSDGARWWSWSRRLESTGRAGLLGWAGPRRVYRQPQPPRPGGEKTQVQTSGWRAAAAAAAAGREQRTQSDALRSTRHPPAVQHTPVQHTCYTQHCFSELLDNINNIYNTTTAALQLRCGDIGRQELSCAGQRCSLSDGDRQWSCQ